MLRKTALTLTAIALLLQAMAFGARAQLDKLENTTPEQRAKAQTDLMVSRLGLNPEQTTQVAALNLKYANKAEPVLKGSEGPLMKLRHLRQFGEQKEAELKGILTPAQFQKYLVSKEEMKEKAEQRLEEKAGKAK